MCTSLILSSLKVSLHLFNALHILVGLVIASFGCYLQIDYGTYVVTIVSLALGGYILLLGCLGLVAVRLQNWCLLTVCNIPYFHFDHDLYLIQCILCIIC